MKKYKYTKPVFYCPNDGELKQDDVLFICNHCDAKEAKLVDGMYICKECETAIHPFQCRLCESKEVSFFSPLKLEE